MEFGEGQLQSVGKCVKEYGSKVLMTIDPFLETNGVGDKILASLAAADVQAIKFSQIEPNPSCFKVDEAGEICRAENCQLVLAVGGGSALDFAKAVAVVAMNSGSSWDYTERSDHEIKRPKDALPVIAVPTTSGTGSEATPFAVLNNTKLKEKSTIVSDKIFVTKAIVDPEITYSMPPRLTASTGFDVFAHALESYISLAATPFSRIVAKEAMTIVTEYLPQAVANGGNSKARAKMAWASVLGGASITYVGVTLPHSLGQPVGGLCGAPHGESVAACLVEILKMSYTANPEVFADITAIMDPSLCDLSVKKRAALCPEVIQSFLDDIKLRIRFSDFGMTEKDIDKVTSIALTGYYFDIKCHPKQVTEADIRALYAACL
jgi:alcohol dehydrogenase class IV